MNRTAEINCNSVLRSQALLQSEGRTLSAAAISMKSENVDGFTPPLNFEIFELINRHQFFHAAMGVAKKKLVPFSGIVFALLADGSAAEHQDDVPLPRR